MEIYQVSCEVIIPIRKIIPAEGDQDAFNKATMQIDKIMRDMESLKINEWEKDPTKSFGIQNFTPEKKDVIAH